MVLDSFIKTSATGGLGSIKAEVMADTAVALASGNVKLVSSKVRKGASISFLLRLFSKKTAVYKIESNITRIQNRCCISHKECNSINKTNYNDTLITLSTTHWQYMHTKTFE